MNLEYRHLLESDFPPDARVWVYQTSRRFSLSEALDIEDRLTAFNKGWLSHGRPVRGTAYLLFGQFIVLMADERATGVSGCSTDSSVRFIKELEQEFSVHLFDRTTLAFVIKDTLQLLPLSQLDYAVRNGFIGSDTLFFNNVVQTKAELETDWLIPVGKSWLAKKIQHSIPVP